MEELNREEQRLMGETGLVTQLQCSKGFKSCRQLPVQVDVATLKPKNEMVLEIICQLNDQSK